MNRARAAVGVAVGVGLFLLGLATAASAPSEPQVQVWSLTLGTVALLALTRLAASRVSADGTGITLHNFLRKRRIAWDDIDRFAFRQGNPRDPLKVVVQFEGGSEKMLPGLDRTFVLLQPHDRTGLAEVIVDLNDLLQQHRSGEVVK